MKKLLNCLLGLTLAWALPASAETSPTPPGPKAYDAAPFVKGFSRPYQKNTARKLGIKSLSDLPLYQLDMELNAVLGTLKIKQDVNFKNTTSSALNDLVFRTYPNVLNVSSGKERNLEFGKITINGQPGHAQEINPSAWRITLAQPLLPGQRVLIGLQINAVIPRMQTNPESAGFTNIMAELMGKQGREGYGIYARHEGIFNLGFFYPILPVRMGQDWDTELPAGMGDVAHFDVANYLVKLRVPKTMLVASSGTQVGEQALGTGPQDKKEVYLMGAALRHFALQLSTRYVTKQKKVNGINVRVFVLQERKNEADKLLGYAAGAVQTFMKLFGHFPYSELDVADAPLIGGAGGMEYPGLVTVAVALTNPQTGGPMGALIGKLMESTATVEFVLAHEVAHQWFHVLVGSDSNRHPFLDEALANYAAVLYFEKRHGSQAAINQLQMQLAMPYQLHRAFGGRDGRVDRAVKDFSNQLEYAALVYGKGALFFHFLRTAIGKKTFFRCLKNYIRNNAFRQADPADLLKAFVQGSKKGRKVKALYKRWIHERHADQDLAKLKLPSLNKLLGQLKNLKGFHNVKLDGAIDPATLRLFQQAIKQISGGP
ncbi:MAG: M1 family metallopeptidase [Deltaproteobacteria bacterium]|nr:M1 family metallopeptidase [Deltaproteobacteria bacterium]